MLTRDEIRKLMGHYLRLISKAKLRGDKAQRQKYEYQLRLLEVAYGGSRCNNNNSRRQI